ncbi:MAG: EscU/YscU/HrcU family type III secretion system export apparatus switch protein [Chloroflexi bacterium]|nr:EscU/YscU/HrcU family type III secretion system export apparatus switch protein [Chloroflexota bacterium]
MAEDRERTGSSGTAEAAAPPPGPRAAVALNYERGKDAAPRVVASGRGLLAERILDLAREHGVPVREDPDLVQLLARLDVGEVIPPDLYPVIAEVFAFIYRLNAERARSAR